MTAHDAERRISAVGRTVLTAAAILSLVAAADAGEVAEKAAEAEALLQSGEPGQAFEALRTAVDAFWAAAPLTIREAYFVAGRNGTASRRPEGPFRPGEHVRIYLEPLGYGFIENAGGFRIAMKTGIEIRTPGGLILAKADDFGALEWAGPAKSRTFTGRVGIDLPDLKPGDYELFLTLNDEASQKTAQVTLPFSVAQN